MARFLRPVTPTGSPAVDDEQYAPDATPAGSLSRFGPSAFLEPILECQDPNGLIAIGFFGLSTISSGLVWTIAAGLFPMEHYQLAALFIQTIGKTFYVIAWGFGLWSEKRLPRWLSAYLLTVAVIWYGWHAVGLSGSIYPWNIITHTVIGAVLALPALVADGWRRWTGTA